MNDAVYDITIGEVAKILDKSDRQVRRYVKERRLKAQPVRVDGHIKLMFSKEEVDAFKQHFTPEGMFGESGREIVVDPGNIDTEDVETDEPVIEAVTVDSADAVKYVVDVLREQITNLRDENKDLHYQLEQRSGQVGFLQGQIESLQGEIKALSPIPKAEQPERPSWLRRLFGLDS